MLPTFLVLLRLAIRMMVESFLNALKAPQPQPEINLLTSSTQQASDMSRGWAGITLDERTSAQTSGTLFRGGHEQRLGSGWVTERKAQTPQNKFRQLVGLTTFVDHAQT
jgi:hypothetical protein